MQGFCFLVTLLNRVAGAFPVIDHAHKIATKIQKMIVKTLFHPTGSMNSLLLHVTNDISANRQSAHG